ncbi:hypothetical protein [Castellaniella sp.]|uniref:hypothetical protein n=1 Tax=Castellaniella sp. TaxID=1955812 RepID=UPI002AFE33BF|nr:hypothetical protein [Castellaniella sp.]
MKLRDNLYKKHDKCLKYLWFYQKQLPSSNANTLSAQAFVVALEVLIDALPVLFLFLFVTCAAHLQNQTSAHGAHPLVKQGTDLGRLPLSTPPTRRGLQAKAEARLSSGAEARP